MSAGFKILHKAHKLTFLQVSGTARQLRDTRLDLKTSSRKAWEKKGQITNTLCVSV